MIAACPKCGARYRIEDGRLGPQGARLRCARCEAIFRVRAPRSAPAAQRPVQAAAPSPPPARPAAPRPLVIVADPDPERGRATAQALDAVGLEGLTLQDGVETILEVQRRLPRAVVLDATLPRMLGSQVCELIKRNESLRRICVVLVADGPEPGDDPHAADARLERAELPSRLMPVLRRLGLELNPPVEPVARVTEPVEPAPAASEAREERMPSGVRADVPASRPDLPASRVDAPASRVDAPASPIPPLPELDRNPAATAGMDPAEVAKAQRLARIVISDIVLYNAAKFEAAVRMGRVLEAMRDELAEGRSLFRQRIESRVRESQDFLAEEMLRVARERGSR